MEHLTFLIPSGNEVRMGVVALFFLKNLSITVNITVGNTLRYKIFTLICFKRHLAQSLCNEK